MIDYKTILSTTQDKLTLLQWLKKVEEALKSGSATAVKGVTAADGTFKIEIDFADGTSLVSEPIAAGGLPDGYAVDASGNITLNDALHVAKTGDVEVGKNLEVDGTLTLNTPEDLKLKTGSLTPPYYTVDDTNNYINIGGVTVYTGDESGDFDAPGVLQFGSLKDYNEDFAIKSLNPNDILQNRTDYDGYRGIFNVFNLNEIWIGQFVVNDDTTAYFYGVILRHDGNGGDYDLLYFVDVPAKITGDGSVNYEEGSSYYDLALEKDVSIAKYQHTVTIKATATADAGGCYITFTAYSSKNTPIDSYQDLNSLFGGCALSASGAARLNTADSGKGALKLDLHGGTIATDAIVCLEASGTEYSIKLSALGSPAFSDDVCVPK